MTPRSAGFTVVEALAVAALVAILSATSIGLTNTFRQRERVNAAALELTGWLETMRRTSLRDQPCTITFTNGTVTLTDDDGVLASADDDGDGATASGCRPAIVRLPATTGAASFDVTPSQAQITFTRRGSLDPIPPNNTPVEITIRLNDNGPGRCVRLAGMLGLIEIGRQQAAGCVYRARL